MAAKIAIFILAASLALISAEESSQSGPDFTQFFNQLQEQLKPFTSNFPSPPNGGNFGNNPFLNFFGNQGQAPTKREAPQPFNTFNEWLEQFGQNFGQGNFPNPLGGNNPNPISGNLPFNPPSFPFGNFGGNGNGNSN